MDITIAHVEKELYKFNSKMIVIRFEITSDISRTIITEKKTFIKLMKYFLELSCYIRINDDENRIEIHIMKKLSERRMNKHIDNLYDLCSKTRKMKYIN